jgi:hypothetical protein
MNCARLEQFCGNARPFGLIFRLHSFTGGYISGQMMRAIHAAARPFLTTVVLSCCVAVAVAPAQQVAKPSDPSYALATWEITGTQSLNTGDGNQLQIEGGAGKIIAARGINTGRSITVGGITSQY